MSPAIGWLLVQHSADRWSGCDAGADEFVNNVWRFEWIEVATHGASPPPGGLQRSAIKSVQYCVCTRTPGTLLKLARNGWKLRAIKWRNLGFNGFIIVGGFTCRGIRYWYAVHGFMHIVGQLFRKKTVHGKLLDSQLAQIINFYIRTICHSTALRVGLPIR